MVHGIGPRPLFIFDVIAVLGVSIFYPEYLLAGSKVLTLAALFAASVGWIAVYHGQIYPKLLSPLRSLPQAPNGTFWHGQWGKVRREDTGVPMLEWINTVPNKGVLRYTILFNTERVLLTTPEALREVLVTKSYDFVKPTLARNALGRLLGVGVLLAEGDEHKFQRKNLMPAFAYRHVKDLVPTFWSKSAKMIQAIDKENETGIRSDDGVVVQISDWLSRCTLDIIGAAGMGFDFGAIRDPNTELNRTYRDVFTPNRAAQRLEILTMFVPIWLVRAMPSSRNSLISDAAATIRRISREVIQAKQQKMAAAKEKSAGLSQEGAGKDIISVAVDSGAFSEDNLVDQVMTFLAAGHETTSTAMAWAMVELGRNPEVQQKLRDEIRRHLPSPLDENAPAVTAEQIDSLPYLHAVCNELLRVRPPVPVTRREAVCDTVICGQHIPKGTDVFIAPRAINFSKALWGPDADEFKPERWLGKNNANSGGADSNFALLTFLHGPRSCIGQKFAQMEFACLLANVVGSYHFELEPKDVEIKIHSGVTAKPKGPLPVRLRAVPGW